VHEVRIGRSAAKELEALPGKVVQRIATKIDALAQQPRPSGCRKLKGADDLWRIRVGDYRIIYAVNDIQSVVEVRMIRHRGDAYRPA
jgi:mRNA interferase RelE/StbE